MLALTGAALAVAKGLDFSTKSVTATFTATTVSGLHSTTCTTADGSFTDTKGKYKGTAVSSEPTLNGPITLNLHSLINTSKDLGTVSGDLSIGPGGPGHTHAHLTAVYSGGNIAGVASGHVGPHVGLLGNLSATFNPTTGLTSGKLGNSSGGAAVETTPGRCGPHGPGHHGPAPKGPKAHGPTGPHGPSGPAGQHTIHVHGTVSALASDSITVAGVQCTIPSNLQASVASHVKVGNQVEMSCTSSGGTNTLTRVEVKKAKK